MQLKAEEKSFLVKAAKHPIAGFELTRKEQKCISNLERLGLITVFGHPDRIDLQIFKTQIAKCTALLAHLTGKSKPD